MKIKQVIPKDLDIAYQYQRHYTDDKHTSRYWKKKYEKTPELFVACYDNEEIIGICIGRTRGNKVILTSIAVSVKFQNQGIGKKLLTYFESQVKKIGRTTIGVAAVRNTVGFYTNAGYEPVRKGGSLRNCIILEKNV